MSRFASGMKELNDRILQLSKKRPKLDIRRHKDEVKKREVTRIEKGWLKREQERQNRKMDCEKSAGFEIEKFCFMMEAFQRF